MCCMQDTTGTSKLWHLLVGYMQSCNLAGLVGVVFQRVYSHVGHFDSVALFGSTKQAVSCLNSDFPFFSCSLTV